MQAIVKCPGCGNEFRDAVNVGDLPRAAPIIGDICFCGNCGCVGIYTDTAKVDRLSLEASMHLPQHVKSMLVEVIKSFWEMRGEPMPPEITNSFVQPAAVDFKN